jgi:hypothetical protein
MNQYVVFICVLALGLAAISFFLRFLIDSMFTNWDPVQHYRVSLNRLVKDRVGNNCSRETQQQGGYIPTAGSRV